MKKTLQLLVLLLAVSLPVSANATSLIGDVNGDGEVKIGDVTALINYLLSNDASGINLQAADCNQDGDIKIGDVTVLINYLLAGNWSGEVVHEWVDLGLPSGTLWATCNVGADSPEEYGDYFAWGETSPKDTYNLSTYKWCTGSSITMTKYCNNSSYGYNGFVDNKTELDLEDDAAYVNWGAKWRMPSLDQQTELRTQCIWTWTTQNGVYGSLVTGSNGKSLFLPAAGCRIDGTLRNAGSLGHYWSQSRSTLSASNPVAAYSLNFRSDSVCRGTSSRPYGLSVRAVRVP